MVTSSYIYALEAWSICSLNVAVPAGTSSCPSDQSKMFRAELPTGHHWGPKSSFQYKRTEECIISCIVSPFSFVLVKAKRNLIAQSL